ERAFQTKIRRVVSAPMRFQKKLTLCLAAVAARSTFAAEPAPSGNPDPLPALRATPAKASPADSERFPLLEDPAPRPATMPSLLPDEIPANSKRSRSTNTPAVVKPALKVPAAAVELEMR